MRVAFNMSSGSLAERAAWLPVEKFRGVVDGDLVVAAAAHTTSGSGGAGASSG